MKERFVAAIASIALLAPAIAAGAQSEQPLEQRDIARWSGDVWQRLLAMPITQPDAKGRPVNVKIPKSGANIEADVFVVSLTCVDRATDAFLRSHFHDSSVALLASRFGTRYHTDKFGYVRVAMPDDGFILAVAGDRIGKREPQKGTTFVAVHDHGIVRAEVIDKDGRPAANVPITVSHVHNQYPLARACSDAHGRVALRIPKSMLGRQVSIEANIASIDRGTELVPKSYFDKAPALLQVQLPATGELHATIADDLGVLPTPSSQAKLMWFVGDQLGARFGLAPARWQGGTAVFTHVALGLPLEVSMKGGSRVTFRTEGTGPAEAGDTAKLSVRVPAEQLALRGRLLVTANERIQAGTCRVRIAGPRGVQDDYCAVDADGRFLMAVDSSQFLRSPVRFEFFAGQAPKNQPNLVAITTVQGDRRGIVELGDLQLQRERVLVGGRIMLGNKPVSASIAAPLSCDPDGPVGHRINAGIDGKFVLHEAAPPSGVLKLSISYGWPPKNQQVTATIGKADQVFQLAAGATLSFTVADPGFLPLLRFQAVSRQNPKHITTGSATSDGFRFQDLNPGPHDITVHLGRHELVRFDGVDADRGAADPDHQNITWQGTFQTCQLRILDAAGSPKAAYCYLATGDNKNSLPRLSDKDGRVSLPFAPGDRVFVRSGSSRNAIITPSDKLQTIRVRPRATLHLRLPKGLTLPGFVELHFSSELQQFGLKDHVHAWRPRQPNSVQTEANERTVLRVIARHINGQPALLHEQTIELPDTSTPIEVIVGIDEDDAAFAADLAAQRKRGGR